MQLPEVIPEALAAETSVISRRNFLRGTAAIAIGACIGSQIAEPDHSPGTGQQAPSSVENPAPNQENEWNYGDDTLLAAKLLGIETVSILAAKAIRIDIGNAGSGQLKIAAAKDPVDTMMSGIAIAPAVEELAFRLLPSAIADSLNPQGRGNKRWALGVATSGAFALFHNFRVEKKSLPIPQFISGLGFWYAQRRGGYRHALFAHAAHNAAPVTGIVLGAKINNANED